MIKRNLSCKAALKYTYVDCCLFMNYLLFVRDGINKNNIICRNVHKRGSTTKEGV